MFSPAHFTTPAGSMASHVRRTEQAGGGTQASSQEPRRAMHSLIRIDRRAPSVEPTGSGPKAFNTSKVYRTTGLVTPSDDWPKPQPQLSKMSHAAKPKTSEKAQRNEREKFSRANAH